MGYSLLVDVFDVTCMGDTTEHYLYAPYTPPIWDTCLGKHGGALDGAVEAQNGGATLCETWTRARLNGRK